MVTFVAELAKLLHRCGRVFAGGVVGYDMGRGFGSRSVKLVRVTQMQ